MSLGNKPSTSPKAEGSPKKGAVGGSNFGRVSLPQHGGEGKGNYKGQKSDSKLPQHGGEGGGREGKVKGGSDKTLLNPAVKGYAAGGRFLGKA